jgi:hypothetical protein
MIGEVQIAGCALRPRAMDDLTNAIGFGVAFFCND